MADIADVEQSLVNAITSAVYPNTTSSPSAIVVGSTASPAKIYAGWPAPGGQLDADLIAVPPIVHISVFTQGGMEQDTTRFPRTWYDQFKVVSTFAPTIAANHITIGGTASTGHYVTVEIGRTFVASYAALVSDTPTTVATALAALINVSFPTTTASGTVITMPATVAGRVVVRTAAPGTVIQELERTNQFFCVTIWAANNALRVATSKLIRPALASVDYLFFPDTSCGRILYHSSRDMDDMERQNVYRRDISYSVEYATCLVQPGYPITAFQGQISDEYSPADTYNVNT